MEDTLRGNYNGYTAYKDEVLILVLMEDTLRVIKNKDMEKLKMS